MSGATLPNEGSRLAVAVAGHGERMQALLNAYLDGPGRRIFVQCEEAQAQAMIADCDNPGARADLRRFVETYGRPGIALAHRDPGLAQTVWVPKPVDFDGLAAGAAGVRQILAAAGRQSLAQQADAQAPVQHTPSAPALQSELVPLIQPHPAGPLPVVRAAKRGASGEGGNGTAKVTWVTIGVLAVVGASSLLGWTPSIETWRLRGSGQPAPTSDSVEATLQQAVQASQKDYRMRSEADRQFISQQLGELTAKSDAEEVRARLDRLAQDPAALAAYNQNVLNQVRIDGKSDDASTQGRARREVESAVSEAAAAGSASNDEGLVRALKPEAEQRAAEMRTIIVAKGDTLGSIAAKAYGDSARYPLIFKANPRVLTSPHHIYPGQVLRVPEQS